MRLSKAREAVEAFESDRIDAVLEHKTAAEWWELLGSATRTGGLTLSALARYDSREPGEDEPTMEIEYDATVLGRVVRRIQLRRQLGLEHRECAIDEPDREREASHCVCLSARRSTPSSSPRRLQPAPPS